MTKSKLNSPQNHSIAEDINENSSESNSYRFGHTIAQLIKKPRTTSINILTMFFTKAIKTLVWLSVFVALFGGLIFWYDYTRKEDQQRTRTMDLIMNSIAASAKPHTISTDGSEVIENSKLYTGLIWRRCVEGMVFSGGTCIGSARKFTYKKALQHAKSESRRTGIAWRVPDKYEFTSIIGGKLYSNNLSIDPTAFPSTPADNSGSSEFWSASPGVGYSSHASVVDFSYGGIHGGDRNDSHYVRLVRGQLSDIEKEALRKSIKESEDILRNAERDARTPR